MATATMPRRHFTCPDCNPKLDCINADSLRWHVLNLHRRPTAKSKRNFVDQILNLDGSLSGTE